MCTRRSRREYWTVFAPAPLPWCVVILLTSCPWLSSGELEPPVAIRATMKNLSLIEPRREITSLPFVITTSTSYYLATSLTALPGMKGNGIEIRASNVTLDLSGFTLTGNPQSPSSAIWVAPGVNCVKIRNGFIQQWGGAAVSAGESSDLKLEDLCVTSNTSGGLIVGDNSIITDCIARSNGGSAGIAAGNGCLVTNCAAMSSVNSGISTRDGSVVRGCASRDNGMDGFSIKEGVTLVECAASLNNQGGVLGGSGNTIAKCSTLSNGIGIWVAHGCTITESTARDNTRAGPSFAFGIHGGPGSTVANCSASGNGVGIDLQDGSTVTESTASLNSRIGIQVLEGCLVLANTASVNRSAGPNGGPATGIGILAGDRSHVERNLATGNAVGFEAAMAPTWMVMIRNSAGANTVRNYPVPPNEDGEPLGFPLVGHITVRTDQHSFEFFDGLDGAVAYDYVDANFYLDP